MVPTSLAGCGGSSWKQGVNADFIEKPFTPTAFLARIRRLLDSG
jgi:hypothetical protein